MLQQILKLTHSMGPTHYGALVSLRQDTVHMIFRLCPEPDGDASLFQELEGLSFCDDSTACRQHSLRRLVQKGLEGFSFDLSII